MNDYLVEKHLIIEIKYLFIIKEGEEKSGNIK